MPLLDHFDLLAPIYDRVIARPEDLPLREVLGGRGYSRILDAGGGTGRVAEALSDLAEQLILFDASTAMLRQAEAKDCCQLVNGHTEHLPFLSGTFDGIIVVDAFHHLGDQGRSLQEMWRALAPGGRLVVEEPDIRHWAVKVVAAMEKLALMRSRFVVAERVAEFLEGLGATTEIHRQGHTAWIVAERS